MISPRCLVGLNGSPIVFVRGVVANNVNVTDVRTGSRAEFVLRLVCGVSRVPRFVSRVASLSNYVLGRDDRANHLVRDRVSELNGPIRALLCKCLIRVASKVGVRRFRSWGLTALRFIRGYYAALLRPFLIEVSRVCRVAIVEGGVPNVGAFFLTIFFGRDGALSEREFYGPLPLVLYGGDRYIHSCPWYVGKNRFRTPTCKCVYACFFRSLSVVSERGSEGGGLRVVLHARICAIYFAIRVVGVLSPAVGVFHACLRIVACVPRCVYGRMLAFFVLDFVGIDVTVFYGRA